MEKQTFIIQATNDKIWNLIELIRFLSVNQNTDISLSINPEAICLRHLRLYDLLDCFQFASVTISTQNPLETHSVYNIINPWSNKFLTNIPVIPDGLQTWTGAHKFLSFYYRPTAGRLGIASYLFKHYKDQSLIHFSYNNDDDKIQLYEFDKLSSLSVDSLNDATDMIPSMPLLAYDNHKVNDVEWYDYSADQHLSMYKDIFVDIVVETHVIGNTFFPTEKTVRPMWLKKPFLIFASRNYLDHLHQLGFLTFGNFWSEEYDGFEHKDRYLKILEVIDMIASKSTGELLDMYQQMQHIVDHNYKLLATQSFTTDITPIV